MIPEESTIMYTPVWPVDAQNAFDPSVRNRAGESDSVIHSGAEEATSTILERADELAAKAGCAMESFAQTILEQLPQEGIVGEASQAVAKTLQQGGRYLESNKLSETGTSVENLIRRYPYESIMAGIVAGYLGARILRR